MMNYDETVERELIGRMLDEWDDHSDRTHEVPYRASVGVSCRGVPREETRLRLEGQPRVRVGREWPLTVAGRPDLPRLLSFQVATGGCWLEVDERGSMSLAWRIDEVEDGEMPHTREGVGTCPVLRPTRPQQAQE